MTGGSRFCSYDETQLAAAGNEWESLEKACLDDLRGMRLQEMAHGEAKSKFAAGVPQV